MPSTWTSTPEAHACARARIAGAHVRARARPPSQVRSDALAAMHGRCRRSGVTNVTPLRMAPSVAPQLPSAVGGGDGEAGGAEGRRGRVGAAAGAAGGGRVAVTLRGGAAGAL